MGQIELLNHLKAKIKLATTQCVWEGATPFLGLLHFTLDIYLIMLSVKRRDIKYHFSESLV